VGFGIPIATLLFAVLSDIKAEREGKTVIERALADWFWYQIHDSFWDWESGKIILDVPIMVTPERSWLRGPGDDNWGGHFADVHRVPEMLEPGVEFMVYSYSQDADGYQEELLDCIDFKAPDAFDLLLGEYKGRLA